MSISASELQKMLEWAQKNDDQEAVDAVTAEINKLSGDTPEPEPEGALPQKIDYKDPEQYALAGKRYQERERALAQEAYDYDQELAHDPANRPTRKEMNEFIRHNENVQHGASMVNALQQQMIRDPKTGKVRWTAMSPEQMDRHDARGELAGGVIGALAYGSTRFGAATVANADAEIDKQQNFQEWLLAGQNSLPKAEQERIRNRLIEEYGADHRYVRDPGTAPANAVKKIMDENPDNEASLDALAGAEWGAERKEFFKRLGNRASAVIPGMPVNIFGADETMGALTGRERFEGIEYEEGEAPAYPGASEDLRDWRSAAKYSTGIYEGLIKPLVEGRTGKAPGTILTEGAEAVRDKFYSERQEAEHKMPLFNPDKEVNKFSDLFDPELYTSEEGTKFQNPESLFLMFLENAPELGFSFAVTRGAGAVGARTAAREAYRSGQTVQRMNKAREVAAGRSGMVAGGATEGVLVAGHVEAETRQVMQQIPDEVWQQNPMFQKLTEGGLPDETAKQIMAQEAASKAGTTAAVVTMMTGAPMNRFMGRSAAGRLIQSRPTLRRMAGLTGEPVTEGAQEVFEMLQTEAAVRPIDPNNPIFDNPNRYLEAFTAGALISLPFGAMSALEPAAPEGVRKEDVDAARATANYMEATNERFKYEMLIADPEHIANTTPNERLMELEKLEGLQEKEADAILKAEPKMRAFLERQGTATAQTELKMLNRLVMRANAVKSDIAVARSKRTTATQLQEEERRVMQDRADLQRRVNEDIVRLEDIERMTASIEKVQNLEALTTAEAEELIEQEYAKRRESDGQLVILPKGKRATKELNRQARRIKGRLESGYTGPERRQSENVVQRGIVDEMGPAEREKSLYTDPLTDSQNRRAFNERQENIDVKKGQTKRDVPGAAPAVASVDVDSLKWVNDNMTHSAGDRLLMAVSDAMSAQEGVEVFRLGGDEFAVTGASQEALESALQAAASQLSETEIVAGNDSVTPTITWGKGTNYAEADTQAVDMKRDRQRRGVVANRKGEPASYKVRSQGALFQMDQGDLPRTYRRVKGIVERGDSVEILTPDGATMGVVTEVSNKRGRGRIRVNVQGREFLFNADSNHLIVDDFTDPADLAWITGDAEFAQPGRDTFPQIMRNISIGHLGKDGVWYADLGADYEPDVPLPWWMDTYPNLDLDKAAPVQQLPEADPAYVARADTLANQFRAGYDNMPRITVVRSIQQLKREEPQIVDQIIREGGNLNTVKGYMDHINPKNGVYVFVQNLGKGKWFEQNVTEVLAHEIIGHWGVRGFFKHEAKLRHEMSQLVDAFPRLADHYAVYLGLNKALPEDKQLIAEEMVAYIAGEVEAGREVFTSQKQKNLWQRILFRIKQLLTRMGFDRWSPIKKMVSLHDSKEVFWNDSRVQQLLHRSQDFLRTGKKFEWYALGGSTIPFMRDGHIFQSGVMQALDAATYKPSRNQKQQLAKRYGGIENVPDEVPLFPDEAKVGAWKQVLTQVQKEKWATARDLELSGLSDKADYNLLRDATYGTLKVLHDQLNNGIENPSWHHGILPPALSAELDAIREAYNKNVIVGPMQIEERIGFGEDEQIKMKKRPSVNEMSAKLMRARIAEIMEQKIDPKKTIIPKDLIRAHLLSDNAFRVTVKQSGDYAGSRASLEQIAERLFGDLTEEEYQALDDEKMAMIKAERDRVKKYGWDIGFDEEQQRWFDWTNHTSEYAEWSPQGSRINGDFRVALIQTEGRNGEMGYSGHYEKNLMHLRTGVAELLNWEGKPLITSSNPDMENLMLSLVELQSDWLQKLRKGFTNADEKRRARDRINAIADQLRSAVRGFGENVAEDLRNRTRDMLRPIANLPDGLTTMSFEGGEPTTTTGSLFPKMENFVRERTGRLWADLEVSEKKDQWKNFLVESLDQVVRQFMDVENQLNELEAKLPLVNVLPGTMDARAFEFLDNQVASDMIEQMRHDIKRTYNAIHEMRYAEDQADVIHRSKRIVSEAFTQGFAGMANSMDLNRVLRIPMLDYRIEAILDPVYDFLEADKSNIPDHLSTIAVRESATARVPKAPLVDLATATLQNINQQALLEDILSQSRISRNSDLRPGEYSITVQDANEEWLDIEITGTKATIGKLQEVIPNLITKWVTEHGQEKRDVMLRAAERQARSNRVTDNDYSYREVRDWLGMEEADVDEGDSMTSDHSVTTFYEFEQEMLEDGDIERELINEAFNQITEDEWNNLDDDHPGVGRAGSTYREALEIDEDGDVDNSTAESDLEEARETYRTEVMWDDEDLRMQAYEQIREAWYDRGPTALAVGSLPVSWDSDGDPESYVSLVVVAREPGDNYSIQIDGEEYDYEFSFDDAKEGVAEQIKEYYENEEITPPPGSMFAPDDPEQDQIVEETLEQKDKVNPNWEMVASNITEFISIMSDKPTKLKPLYEEYVRTHKKLENGSVHKDSPLSKDEQWRPLALKYLIADAVRRGLGGVVWNNGLASATRGGIGMSDIQKVPRITWSKETMEIRGEQHSVYVIRAPEMRPIVVSPDKMVPVLGTTTTRLIMRQEMGKEPIPDVTKKAETDQTEDEDFNPRDNYLISRTNNNIYVVYRRSNHDVVGFADNDEQLDEIIANDQQHYGRHEREQREQQIEAERFADLTQLEPIGSAIEASGIITESMVGNLIHVITGHTTRGFAHTFKPPLLAGARQSYEDITYKIWNKELKKYGVQIKETFVNTRDQRKAMEEEGGEAIVIESREDKIKAEHGTLEIQELQGDMHGWVVISEKKGLVFNDVWENKRYAEERLARYIEENFGTEGEGVRVQYFEINDKMREEFSKPTAPFMMGRRNEPEALKDMRGKIGVPKGRRMQDLRDRIKVFRQGFVATAQQGIFDEFYGLKRALREAGVTDESYIDARLSTSLDSMMKGVLFYGHPVWKEGIVQSEGRGLMEILQPILSNHEDWGIFMAARRGRELMLEGYDKLSDEDKALIDRAAEKFGGNIIDMISFSEMQDPELGERQGDTMSKSARRRTFELERDIEQLQEETKKGIYRDKEGRRITIEQVRESAASLREKWAGINRRRKKPSKAFINRVRSHLKFYEDQLNPDAAIERLQKQYDEFMTRYKPHKKKKHKPWAKRDRVKEAEGAIKRLKEAGREHLFTAGNIRAGLQLGETNPVFQRVADEYAEFNKKMLDFAEESGLINPEDRDTWESANYVPFYRVDDERLIGSSFSPRAGIANQKAPIRRLKGGKQNVGDVVGNIMVNTAKLLDASVKNNAALNAIDALRGTGVVQKKPLAFEPVLIEMGQLQKILIDRGIIVPDDEEGIHLSDIDPKALEGFQKMFAIGAPKGDGIMSVMRNGKREYYYTDDALLFRSMTAINKKQFGEWIQMFTGPKRLLTTLITVDPAFMVANFLRDTGSAFVIGRDHWGNIPFVSALKGFNQALMNDEAIRTMTSAGAAFENGYITGGDPRRVKRLIKQHIKDPRFYDTIIDTPAKAARAWLTLGAAVENSNRVAMYNAAIAAGKSKKRAVFEAKDLMDFSMGGDWTVIRFLIQTVPFMNARNQGNYRLGKAMVENPVAFAVKGMLVGLAGFALWAAFKDDERYKDLEMWDKHAYFHFWIGDMHFRIPKPFEVGAIFNTQVEMWGNYLNSKENDAGKYLLREYGHMVGQTFALLPFPQTFAPVLESGINYSFFKQGPLVGYYEQKRLPPDQYRYRTSPTLIELAKRMPKELDTVSNRIRSPLHLQNLYLGYTGTIGRYLLQGADMLVRRSLEYPLPPAPEAPDWIVAGRFYRGEGPARRTKYEDEVYRMLSKTTEIQGSLAFHERYGNAEEYEKTLTDPDYQPYIRAADALEGIRENITEVNKAIQMIYLDTEMDRDKKTEEINLLEETRNNLFREAYKLRPGGEYNPVDAPPATDEQALLMIEEWGVDNSTAFMRRIQEQTPNTYELLEMISNDMNSRQLKMLAKAGN